MKRILAVALSLLFALSAFGDEVAGAWFRETSTATHDRQPPLRATSAVVRTVADVPAPTENALLSMRHHNATGRIPQQNGIVTTLAEPVSVRADGPSASTAGPWRWRGAVHVTDASRARLQLTELETEPGTTFWVYGSDGKAAQFDASLAYQGMLWTPSVAGEMVILEVESPSRASFRITAAATIVADPVAQGTECVKDARCYTGLDEIASAVAHMQYISGGEGYVCSGGLIVDSQQTFAPYFITANHCIANAQQAASLETFWDFRTSGCGGLPPSLSNLHRVTGASVVATSEQYDLSLLRLTNRPGGSPRYFLGWTATAVNVGDTLYRLSHPEGQPMRFSTAKVETTSSECTQTSRANYIYSAPVIGTVLGGSSGSPVLNEEGQIVGALSGGCPGSADPCGTEIRTVDGRFSAAYQTVFKPTLNPGTTQCTSCVPNANTACLLGNRFKTTMTWKDSFANLSGSGSIITYAENRPEVHPQYGPLSEAVFFSMYSHAPKSIETIIRMIKGQNINDHYWVFLTGFAGAEYTVTIQDTKTCQTWQKNVAAGATEMTKDFKAFPF